MNKRYPECTREDGNCALCSTSSYGRDCRNNPVNVVAYHRKRLGMTQAELAERMGVVYQHISRLENGRVDIAHIPLDFGVRLAAVLGIEPGELLCTSDL